MRGITQIIVTGDIFRTSLDSRLASTQKVNIEWFYHLVRPSLEMCTNLPIKPLYYTGEKDCLATSLYQANGWARTFETWVEHYEQTPSPRELGLIDRQLGTALVVGYEIPDYLCKALIALEIPYLDFTLHPVRFMDDLVFGLRSNVAGLKEVLQERVVRDAAIRIYAGLAMATLVRLPPIPQCKDLQGVGLFCGQTIDDKVLIRHGRLVQADDFIGQFEEMCSRHERVLIKPHPLAPANPVTLLLTRLFPNTELVDANFYHLMVQEAITQVYSITSSTSIEAAYFGKQGNHFMRYPYVFSDQQVSNDTYLSIDACLHEPRIWHLILEQIGLTIKAIPNISIPRAPSRMRRNLRNYWGADIF